MKQFSCRMNVLVKNNATKPVSELSQLCEFYVYVEHIFF